MLNFEKEYFALLKKYQNLKEELLRQDLIRLDAMAKREKKFHNNLLRSVGLEVIR